MDTQPKLNQIIRRQSPAKINRCLRVLEQRQDGYHHIQSLFQMIDWCDELTFEINPGSNKITLSGMDDIPEQDNLIIQAAKLIQSQSKMATDVGAHIEIKKSIPMGAGLGGGSSNAATTLLALNGLWQLNLDRNTLLTLGKGLGADVPFFLNESANTAWVEGIGEIIIPVEPAREELFLLIFPNCAVNTARVFQHPDLPRNHQKVTTPTPYSKINPQQHQDNHCTPVVQRLFPPIKDCFDFFQQNYPDLKLQLTGTGGTLFVAFDHTGADKAESLATKLKHQWPEYLIQIHRTFDDSTR